MYKQTFLILLCSAWIGICFGASGCTQKTPDTKSSASNSNPFQFEREQVTELTLSKFDSTSDDRWMVILKNENSLWNIESVSDSIQILDRRADDTFIRHLLDSFQTLKLDQGFTGSPSNYGLDLPRFAIQWKTPSQVFEICIGSPVEKQTGVYVSVRPPFHSKTLFVAHGAALNLLGQLSSFNSLRKITWTEMKPDQVDELIIQSSSFYAQREGDRWTDRLHRPLALDIDSFLLGLLETRAQRLVDETHEAEKWKHLLHKKPEMQIQLNDRKGKPQLLRFYRDQSSLYGMNSTRPNTVFELKPKVLSILKKLQKKG